MDEIKAQLNRIEAITKRTEQAVYGDKDIGLNGLVNDVTEMKIWRGKIMLKAAAAGGLVSAAFIGGKAALTRIFGGE